MDNASLNTSPSNTSTKCIRDITVTSVVLPSLYCVLFLAALILNCLASWIFFHIPSSSTFVVYLKNVVVADLLMTLTLPVKVLGDAGLGSWQLRVVYCRYSAVLFYSTMYISILLLGLISLDRFLKIVRPFGRCPLQKASVGKALSLTIWIVMLALALPNTVLSDRPSSQSQTIKCSSLKSHLGLQWHEGFNYFCQVVFWGTLALMVMCYAFISRRVYESYLNSKSRAGAASRRTKAKVFVVVIVFFVCFGPFHFIRVPYTLTQTRGINSCAARNVLYVAKETTLFLSASNTCLDPLIYIFLCRMFRKKLIGALCCGRSAIFGGESSETSTRLEMSNKVGGKEPT